MAGGLRTRERSRQEAYLADASGHDGVRSEKKRGRQMVQSTQPPERSSFPLTLDGSTPEELLKAGKYDWVADYSRQIVHSKVYAVTEAGIEIVLLTPLPSPSDRGRGKLNLPRVLTQYDPPEVGDALRFGAQYPNEQRNTPIIFPHEPWVCPHGPGFVLVLRTYEDKVGLSYAPYSGSLDDWWPFPRIAVRRRGTTAT